MAASPHERHSEGQVPEPQCNPRANRAAGARFRSTCRPGRAAVRSAQPAAGPGITFGRKRFARFRRDGRSYPRFCRPTPIQANENKGKRPIMRGLRALFLGLAALCILAPAATAADLGPRAGRSAKTRYRIRLPSHGPASTSARIWDTAGPTSTGRKNPSFNGSHDGTGGLAGGQIGYNWQAGRVVYGVEADLSGSWIDGANGCCGHSVNWLASVRGRPGLTGFDNRTLFYVTAGAAWADVDYSSVGSFSNTHFGWVVGGGVERALTPNLSARSIPLLRLRQRDRGRRHGWRRASLVSSRPPRPCASA